MDHLPQVPRRTPVPPDQGERIPGVVVGPPSSRRRRPVGPNGWPRWRPSDVCCPATARAAWPSTRTSNPASRSRQKKSKSSSPKNHSGSGSTPASNAGRDTRVAPQQATSTGARSSGRSRTAGRRWRCGRPGPRRSGRRPRRRPTGAASPAAPANRSSTARPAGAPAARTGRRRPRTGRPTRAAGSANAASSPARNPPAGPVLPVEPDHADRRLERRVVEASGPVDHHDHPVPGQPLLLEQGARHVAGQPRPEVGQHHGGHRVGRSVPRAVPRYAGRGRASSLVVGHHGARITAPESSRSVARRHGDAVGRCTTCGIRGEAM